MAHIRKQIRDYLKIALSSSDIAGRRVYVQRSIPLEKDSEACILISPQTERSADASMSGTQERVYSLRITAVVKSGDEVAQDTLDALGMFVERVFATDPTLGGLVQTYEYQAAEWSGDGGGEWPFCTTAMTFAVTYYTDRSNPEISL